MFGAGPEVLPGSHQGSKRFLIPKKIKAHDIRAYVASDLLWWMK